MMFPIVKNSDIIVLQYSHLHLLTMLYVLNSYLLKWYKYRIELNFDNTVWPWKCMIWKKKLKYFEYILSFLNVNNFTLCTLVHLILAFA